MSAKLIIEVDDWQVRDQLKILLERGGNLEPVLAEIGEQVMIQTKSRIEAGGPAPDGGAWAPLSPRYARRKAQLGAGHLPLLVLYGDLLRSIHYEASQEEVQIGTDRVYGAAHQFGRPEINLQARPYLGLSEADEAEIVAILGRYLTGRL